MLSTTVLQCPVTRWLFGWSVNFTQCLPTLQLFQYWKRQMNSLNSTVSYTVQLWVEYVWVLFKDTPPSTRSSTHRNWEACDEVDDEELAEILEEMWEEVSEAGFSSIIIKLNNLKQTDCNGDCHLLAQAIHCIISITGGFSAAMFKVCLPENKAAMVSERRNSWFSTGGGWVTVSV